MDDPWLTPGEAAKYCRKHPDTLRAASIDGRLRSAQPAGPRSHRRYRRSWLDAWLLGEKPPALRPAG